MEIQGRRRSEKFEDRGSSARGGGRAGGGLPIQLIASIARRLGLKGTLIVAVLFGGAYFFLPPGIRQLLLGATGATGSTSDAPAQTSKSACSLSSHNSQACDFSRVILASTEDVWNEKFRSDALPQYGVAAQVYQEPTLVVFSGAVTTGGCGNATSDVGPFYCPADKKLYIDPSFYQVMEQKLKAPGDFAQAYVIAHEVGHHVQNLIGSSRLKVQGETKNQVSVRVELQADCLAGVWGHSARATLAISDADLGEALDAAHAIGDDTLGHADAATFTHGSSAARMRWFKRGFESGDAAVCDTFDTSAQL